MRIVQRVDDRLAATVLTALRAEPTLLDDQIFVTVDGGAATLYGRVHSDDEADQAERIALGVDGIVAVAQSMFVSRPVHGSDRDMARNAARDLLQAPDVPAGVTVTVHDRTLTLTGVVDTQSERAAACRAVRDIEEAQIVVDAIVVRSGEPLPALPAPLAPPVQQAI